MPEVIDELGNGYTATDPNSVAAFNHAIEAYLASSKAVMPMLEAAGA
ncbi:MAG: hypothetical protein U5O39_06565 [Gammaproteobacteria bacterium]|nr:hypothetical protein [Gammaproteobacteria bacterium]